MERRSISRVKTGVNAVLLMGKHKISAQVIDISKKGLQLKIQNDQIAISKDITGLELDDMHINNNSHKHIHIAWIKQEGKVTLCGIEIVHAIEKELADLTEKLADKANKFPQNRLKDYDPTFIGLRQKWIEEFTDVKLNHITQYSVESEDMRGNIENPIGMCQVPLGIGGPIRVNGEYAKGDFCVPMATTEGVLVMTYHRGMRVLSRAGGVNVRVLRDEAHIAPAFSVKNIGRAKDFIKWIKDNFTRIRIEAEKTTRHGKLMDIEPIMTGEMVILKCSYYTQDAQGLNMVNRATDAACKFIASETNTTYILRSDLSAIKKVASKNIHDGQGKAVIADVTIPTRVLRLLQTTPERICEYQRKWESGRIAGGMVGKNIHAANLLAAVFIACGQDAADVAMSHVGVLTYKLTKEKDLYVSMYLPNLMVGTIGGGTTLGTQKECLEIMGCYGTGKAKKFAEIITAAAIAGELSCSASLENGTYVKAHEQYGRNRPIAKS